MLKARVHGGLAVMVVATAGPVRSQVVVEPSMIGVEDAFPTDRGRTELQASYLYSRAGSRFGPSGDEVPVQPNSLQVVTFMVSHGLLNDLDVNVGTYALRQRDSIATGQGDGFGDVLAYLKWHVAGSGTEGGHLAWLAGFTAPLQEEDGEAVPIPSQGYWTFDQGIAATFISGRWVGGASGSLFLPLREDGLRQAFGTVDVGAGYQIASWVKPDLELRYLREGDPDGDDLQVVAGTLGLILNPTANLRVDAGLRFGLAGVNAGKRTTATLNVSWTH